MNHTPTQPSVLLIYTGGTIGMIENSQTGVLEAFDFRYLEAQVPEIKRFGYNISAIAFDPPLDSSAMGPDSWVDIAKVIHKNYNDFDGFVVLHGTDTMAYTASALSFMLRHLHKPVILTGSQLPIGVLRTDGKENLITAIEVAASKRKTGEPYVKEVCILFDNKLMRGNRTTKISTDLFNAFDSPNLLPLASIGINIQYAGYVKRGEIETDDIEDLVIYEQLDSNVVFLKLFPGITETVVRQILTTPNLKGVVMETFGSGNAPSDRWFLDALDEAINVNDIVVANVTQCSMGAVAMKRYKTGDDLDRVGVISGYDITSEAALCKLMYLFGQSYSTKQVKELFQTPLRGEMSVD